MTKRSGRSRWLAGPLLAVAAVAWPAVAAAQNLLTNESFASGLAGWSELGSLAPGDGSRTVGTGAVLDVTAAAPEGTLIGLAQCVPVAATTAYVYGADYQLPAGQPGGGTARVLVGVELYGSPDCTGPFEAASRQGKSVGPASALGVSWYQADGPTGPDALLTGAGTQSARFLVAVEKTTGAGEPSVAAFLDTYLQAVPLPVGLQRVWVE